MQGRRGCDFSTGTPGPTQCLDGGCNGGLVCDPSNGTGVPPATLAEFTLGINGGPDNYDGEYQPPTPPRSKLAAMHPVTLIDEVMVTACN